MKKTTFAMAVIVLSALLVFGAGAIDVVIDGTNVAFNDSTGYPFITQEGRTLVPLRATMEAFGAVVSWDAQTRTALVTKDGATVACKIGERYISRNGTKILNDTSATIVDGRTFLPIRAVLEALDAKVSWDGRVVVTSPDGTDLINSIENSTDTIKNFWAAWNEALLLKQNEEYEQCIEKIKLVAPAFLKASDDVSDAMLYNHLGECYLKLSKKAEAQACFTREAQKWKSAGKTQEAIDAERRASYCKSTVAMYATTTNSDFGKNSYNAPLEPQNGLYFGITLKGSSYKYMDTLPKTLGRDVSGYLLYGSCEIIDVYSKEISEAKKRGKMLQYALEPSSLDDFLSISENDSRYIDFAKYIQKSGVDFFIRFACEMNDSSSKWCVEPHIYIEKFRYVADILHKYAPSCAVVWSPNFYPADTIADYYPGDEYVDYVGLSAYAEHQPETDPLKQGVDRNRFSTVMDKVVSLYGHKKPIIISESGASYRDIKTGNDITDFASRQISDLFTYLPIKYPQIKAAFLFETIDVNGIRAFEFNKNKEYLEAFKKATSSKAYLASKNDAEKPVAHSFELANNVELPAEKLSIHSFVKTIENDFSSVVYKINGNEVARAYSIPYTASLDFSEYKGSTIELSCLAFDSKNALCAEKTYKIKVK